MRSEHTPWRSRRLGPLQVEALEERCLLSLYTFTKIADSSDGLSNFGAAPALNNVGSVAFLADSASPGLGTCLYTGNGGELTSIACEGLLGAQFDPFPSINNDGVAAFVSRSGQKEAVLTGSGGVLNTLYSTQNALFFSFGSPALNHASTVAFWAATPAESFPWIIFAGDGETGSIIDHSDVFWFTQFGTFPSLNNEGNVAYVLFFRPVDPSQAFDSIRIGNGQGTTSLYSTQDGLFSSLGNPVVNDAGAVAFYATLTLGGSGIFAGTGGTAQTIATTGGVFSSFATAPSLNNAGRVAFSATLTSGGEGIFTGYDSVMDRVIATGDALFDSTVIELHFFRQGLNDAGQLAFFARLANGTSGIYRADPDKQPARAPHEWWAAGMIQMWQNENSRLQSTTPPAQPQSWPTHGRLRPLVPMPGSTRHDALDGLFVTARISGNPPASRETSYLDLEWPWARR